MKAEAFEKSQDIQDFKTDLFVTGRVQTATNEQLRRSCEYLKKCNFR
jgi:hypothetical protein